MRLRASCIISVGWIGLALTLAGCLDGAPRSNPLDPFGEGFENVGAIEGRITGFYAPFDGLDGVEVRVEPGPVTVMTRNGGAFRVGDLPAGSYVLTARREGYVTTTDSVTVVVGDIVERVMRMDGMPRVDRFDVRSAHISRWWPPPQELYRLEVTAEVSDPDGISDIDRVWIEVPEVGLVDTLVASGTPGQFLSILQEASLPVGVESLLGHDHVIHVRDRAGYELVSSARKIARVIDATPVASTPTSLATLIDPAPRFNWEPLRMPYPYTYRLDIVRVDENIQTVVQLLENIPADSVSLKIPTPLLSGEYFWTVSVVDEFGNRSRSREAGFRIQ